MKRRDKILENATWLFAHKGYKDTSTAELAKLIGVAEGTVFYHFKTKEALFLAVLEGLKTQLITQFEGYFQEARFEDGLAMALGAVSFYLYLAGIMETEMLLLHRHFPFELAQTNPVCRENLEDIYNSLADIFERAVARGQADGSIDTALEARKAGLILFTLADGLVRFKTYNLYDAGALYNTLMDSCRRLLTVRHAVPAENS